eukprot:5136804-Pleurochrysis_carterae.AAC.1
MRQGCFSNQDMVTYRMSIPHLATMPAFAKLRRTYRSNQIRKAQPGSTTGLGRGYVVDGST